MRPTAANTISNTGNLTGEKVRFSLDENSLAHLHSVLSDLYSDREMAVLRELSTNGYDAQIEAGYDGPVEVELPSALTPTLNIVDHGVGMSVDDLYNIYSKYGASTKRDSDAYTGMLGLGSKAPLALADSFTVTSVKDGVRVVAMVTKSPEGIGELTIIDTVATDDASGTTISIPTNERNSLADKAEQLFRFWDPGTVIVNGRPPESMAGEQISDDMMVSFTLDRDYVVMGNVPYPVEIPTDNYYTAGIAKSRYGHNNFGVVVRVPMGSVHFTPNREALNYTPATVEVLRGYQEKFSATVSEYLNTKISEAQTRADGIRMVMEWRNRFSSLPNVTVPTHWREEKIPVSFTFNHWMWQLEVSGYGSRRKMWPESAVYYERVHSADFSDPIAIIVTGWDKANSTTKPSAVLKRRVKMWLETQGYENCNYVLFGDELNGDGWLDNVPTVTFKEVNAIKLPRTSRATQTPRTGANTARTWTTVTSEGFHESKVTPVGTGDIVYASQSEFKDNYAQRKFDLLVKNLGADVAFALVNKNQWTTFVKDHPNAVHVNDYVATKLRILVDSFTYEDKVRYYNNRSSVISEFDIDKIDDPELVTFITAVKTGSDSLTLRQYRALREAYTAGNDARPEEVDQPTDRYPILGRLSQWDMRSRAILEDVYFYVNSAYARNCEKNMLAVEVMA